jgi:hypothetical protein
VTTLRPENKGHFVQRIARGARVKLDAFMDNDYVLNLDDILHTVETADVVRIRFQLLDKRLVIDNRTNEVEGPLIRLVNRAGSSEESFRNLKRMRPRFPLPEKMTAIFWPKYANTLRSTGVWSAIVQRVEAAGFEDSVRQCEAVMQEMLQLERREIRNAISGEGFKTVWQRTAT